MIASRRGLAVLAVLALALALVVVVDRGGSRQPVDRAIAPGLDPAQISDLTIDRPGKAQIHPLRKDGMWAWEAPVGTAEAQTVDALLAALRGGRWHRRAGRDRAGTPGATLRATAGERTWTFAIGEVLPGGEQVWIARDGDAVLVDSWVATALAPEPLALRMRHLFAGASSTPTITARSNGILRGGQLELTGHPRRRGALWLDPAAVHTLEEALLQIEVTSLGPSQHDPNSIFSIRIDGPGGGDVVESGTCGPDLTLLYSLVRGYGCVPRGEWTAVMAAVRALDAPAEQVVDRRLVPIEPATIELPGGTLDVTGRPRLGPADADPERAAELVAALATRGDVAPLPPATARPLARIVVTDRAKVAVALGLYPGGLAVRDGEPLALRPKPEVFAVLLRPATALLSPVLWVEDPLVVASIAVDGVTYRRGATVGEWTREPVGAVDAPLVDAAATALAAVRGRQAEAGEPLVHHVTIAIAPPVGAPSTHALELGRPRAGGCAARVDGRVVRLELPVCTAVAALAAR